MNHSATAPNLPGLAGEIAAALRGSLTVDDLYGDLGGPLYHQLSQGDSHEVREITAALRGIEGPVLELACGSGRLTLPLLAAGHHVTGVDNSPSLLRLLAERLDDPRAAQLARRLTIVEADIRHLAMDRRYGAALLGTTTVGLLSPAIRPEVFRGVRRHLDPGAPFVLTVFDPLGGRESGQGAARPVETTRTMTVGTSVCTLIDHVTADRSRRHVALFRVGTDREPLLLTSEVHLVTAAEVIAELAEAGFATEDPRPVRGATTGAGSTLIVARNTA
ncbi:daptide-type RiPP biosynthesis methyltransferase [Streptomyces sp. RPT161]|uniref:daptide-type RiPP biosynthesis methyltransferase n=1 Tax=Streptomyces sp. RPT161 TaxID=3015993 RepID=UPI0022B86FE5|nr:daptide-type RiPP biosynthesis methyltransferase [Streptomyces sp. RPT161]